MASPTGTWGVVTPMIAVESLPAVLEPTLTILGLACAIAGLLLSVMAIGRQNALSSRLERALGTEVASELRIAARLVELRPRHGAEIPAASPAKTSR